MKIVNSVWGMAPSFYCGFIWGSFLVSFECAYAVEDFYHTSPYTEWFLLAIRMIFGLWRVSCMILLELTNSPNSCLNLIYDQGGL